MADYDWPEDLVPFASEFYLQPHVIRQPSPFTRASKIYGLSRPLWVCRMQFRGGRSTKWGTTGAAIYGRRLDAFIAKLEGGANRVTLWDFDRDGDGYSFTNAEIAQGVNEVTITGALSGLEVGDYIGGDGRPHIITDLSVVGSDMLATVTPHFDTAVLAGEATFERVSGLFRLTSDDAGSNMSEVGQLSVYSLEFVEDPGPSTDVTYSEETVTYTG